MRTEAKPDWSPAKYASLYCKQFGFHLVPLPPRTKRPVAENWGRDVISDPDAARDYFTAHPDWNMGVALGPSRLCSFDVDDLAATRAIFDEFGWDLDEMVANHPTIQGQAPGLRVMFSVPEGVSLQYHALTWPKQGDKGRFTVWEIRAADDQQRQDVLPPSIHPATGQPYTWITRPSGERGFPPPPEFLLRMWEHWDALKPQFQDVCPWAPKSTPTPKRQPSTQASSGTSVIGSYDDRHSITEHLARYGYRQQGKRWLSPHSQTGLPGVMIFEGDNKAFIHHASDPLCSVESGRPVAPFDLFCHYEHGGDMKKAVRAAGDLLGIPMPQRVPPNPQQPRPALTPAIDPETGEILEMQPTEPEPANDNATAKFTSAPLDVFGMLPPEPMPLDVLPDVIVDYVRDQSELTGSDHGIVALSAIVSAAACITDKIMLQPKRRDPTWLEHPRLWVAIVGDPSTKKSPAISKAVRHVKRIDHEMSERNAASMADYKWQHDSWKEAKKADKNNPPPEPQKPATERLIVEDITVEALSEVLKDNARGVLVLKDELTGWFASMDAYKGGGKGASMDRAHWLEAYNGGRHVIDRVTRGTVIVPNWSACILGGVQPDMMRRVSDSMGNDGLLQRFIVLVAKPAVEDADRVPDMRAMEEYRALFDWLVALQPGNSPVQLTEAAHVCRERVAKLSMRLTNAFDNPSLKAWFGKWTGLFGRLLLVYHVLDCYQRRVHPCGADVAGQTAEKVERLMCGTLLHHGLHFYHEILDAHDRQEQVRQLARLILAKRYDRLTKRDMMQYWKAGQKEDWYKVRGIVETLCSMGWLEPDQLAVDTDGRPRAWTVNPQVHEMFAKHAERERQRRKDQAQTLREVWQARSTA